MAIHLIKDIVEEIWDQIPAKDMLQELVESIPGGFKR